MQSFARVEMEELVNKAALEMGYSSIRDKQKEAILGFLSGRRIRITPYGKWEKFVLLHSA